MIEVHNKIISPWAAVAEGTAGITTMHQAMLAYQRQLIKKWDWLLKEDEEKERIAIPKHMHGVMAMVFENQLLYNLGMKEDTLTTDVTLPIRHALPIIRSVFPRLLAMKICAIQPMPATSGGVTQAFFLNFLRESDSTNLTTLQTDWAYALEKAVPKLGKLTLDSVNVEATKDILAACWSTEVMEDARGAINLDVEKEMMTVLGEDIGREIDSRILNNIMTGATAGNVNWVSTVPAAYTIMEWYETLGHAFVDAEALIYATRYQPTNYVVAGTTLYGYIAKMRSFKSKGEKGPHDAANLPPTYLGAEYVGTFSGQWDIYRSPHITAKKGIMGRYPVSWIDSGYIFMPYIPLTKMPLIYAQMDPDTGVFSNTDAWTRNIRTRNGKYLAVPALFATITVTP